MDKQQVRCEKDSLGEVYVPSSALYGAQTQRAIENFPISGYKLSRSMIKSLGLIKQAAALVNSELGLIPEKVGSLIRCVCDEIISGELDEHFPVDVFQTGSGTSSNMNTNEVIACRCTQLNQQVTVHPNDHVNFGQSSNDVFPTACRISIYSDVTVNLIPALKTLKDILLEKSEQFKTIVRTGRTHLMDAMPVSFGQTFSGYVRQISLSLQGMTTALKRIVELPLGGTAVGTGINTDHRFAEKTIKILAQTIGYPFVPSVNNFEAQGTVDGLVELSSQLKNIAISVIKIVNDIRWMNSGPNAGLCEIELPALQPGSSIMPGKVNPVIEESTAMVCAQVIGCDAAVTVGGLSSNFELNVMQPMVAMNILESVRLLSNALNNFC